MENQHREIKGYRELSAEEIALMNECKALAEQCGAMVDRLRAVDQATPRGNPTVLDQRWISIGATHLQEGWMAVIRGIAQPTTF